MSEGWQVQVDMWDGRWMWLLKPEGFQNEVLAQQLDRDVQVGWFASEQKMSHDTSRMRNSTMQLAQHINSRWLTTRLTDMVKVCTACQLCQCPGPLLLSLSCQDLIYCPLFGQSHHIFVQISLAQDTWWAETHLGGGKDYVWGASAPQAQAWLRPWLFIHNTVPSLHLYLQTY